MSKTNWYYKKPLAEIYELTTSLLLSYDLVHQKHVIIESIILINMKIIKYNQYGQLIKFHL